jgi:Doubled CXXCH motif (Paired_CXXCH_1)/Cytochrome c554 and c-prime
MLRFLTIAVFLIAFAISVSGQQQTVVDPASWGGNHVGKPIPEYVHGDECLFCHRNSIGVTWQKNAHGLTVRQAEDAPELQTLARKLPELSSVINEIGYFLGSRHRVRFLKKSGYGRFSILNLQAVLATNAIDKGVSPSWDKEKFGSRCAGCHATAVDAQTNSFAAFGIDCYACHGLATLDHSNNTALMWLSKKRRDDVRAITSICAQCHVRYAKSRSTGLPYANNFIAGDNLFQDFTVDFATVDDETLNPADRHVLRNVRDVAVRGDLSTFCLTCHDVHVNSTSRHSRARRGAICADCHGKNFTPQVKPYEVHSPLCEY